jgi:hypothetical protein
VLDDFLALSHVLPALAMKLAWKRTKNASERLKQKITMKMFTLPRWA